MLGCAASGALVVGCVVLYPPVCFVRDLGGTGITSYSSMA